MLPVYLAEIVSVQDDLARQDSNSRYAEAVENRQSGRPGIALKQFNQILTVRPADVDSRLNLGLCLYALGRLDEARSEFQRVIAEAPDYLDAYIALARNQAAQDDRDGALLALEQAETLQPGNTEIAEMTSAMASPRPRGMRANLRFSASGLTKDLPGWTEISPSFAWPVQSGLNLEVSALYAERFERTNTYLEGRLSRKFSWGSGHIAIGGSGNASFLPENSLGLGAVFSVPRHSLSWSVDARSAQYGSGNVRTLQPGIEKAWLDGRFALSGKWINVWDEQDRHRAGYTVQTRTIVAPGLTFRGGYADAPETSEGFTIDVKAVNSGLEWELTKQTVLRVDGVLEERSAYNRSELSLGLGWKF